ncbi:MAG: hypothetical protein IPF42_14690 [Candidatus Microthrix sp.]|nr:hypothetical protein [Candidatus Microthrix sp.]
MEDLKQAAADIDEVCGQVELRHDIPSALFRKWGRWDELSASQRTMVAVLDHAPAGSFDKPEMLPRELRASVTDFDADEWSDVVTVATLVSNPMAKSWIEDTLWLTEHIHGSKPHGPASLDAHFEVLSDSDAHVMERIRGAERVAELVRRMGQRHGEAAQQTEQLMRDIMEGITHGGLGGPDDSLCAATRIWADVVVPSPEAVRLLDEVENRFAGPHDLEVLADVRNKFCPDAWDNYDKAIQAFMDESESSIGMRSYAAAKNALGIATRVGHPRQAAIKAAIQHIDVWEGTVPTRIGGTVPAEAVHQWIAETVGSDDLQSSLRRLVTNGRSAVNGDGEPDTERQSFLDYLPVRTFGLYNSTLRNTDAQDCGDPNAEPPRHSSNAVSRNINASLTANFLAPSLKQIFTHYDPDTDELRRLLDPHPHIDETNIEALIDGLVLYTEQRWESSACTLLPRIEQLVRRTAVEANVPIIKEPKGDERGGVSTFGGLLRNLRKASPDTFPEELARRIDFLLTDDIQGFNLRNEILHGLAERPIQQWEATVVVLALLEILLFQPET